ncbi:BrnT family toxin [Hoeflea sp.]|uniref:BrnT family toxin n=1 Tax=Hoeflea sp. TaxID=1940281 RepID=UPI003B027B23
MTDDEFEWDDAKAASNLSKHGVRFEDARAVFHDPFAVELLDDREGYDEERYILRA